MDNKTKESIIKNAIENPLPKDFFKKHAYKVLGEVAQELREAEVPDQFIAEMTAIQLARLNRPSMTELAQSLFPIEPMPLPSAVLFFGKEDIEKE